MSSWKFDSFKPSRHHASCFSAWPNKYDCMFLYHRTD